MSSLWSRAGEAHRCGCRACNTAVNGLGRRATTVGRRRKPTFAELFTACYSSVFATAAVVDAIYKEDRRQQLDEQLEIARRDLEDLREREVQRRGLQPSRGMEQRELKAFWEASSIPHPSQTDAAGSLSAAQRYGAMVALQRAMRIRPYMKEIHQPPEHSISELIYRLKAENYHCSSDIQRAPRKEQYDQLERVVMEEESDESIRTRQSLSPKHARREEEASRRLILELMDRASRGDKSGLPSPSLAEARKFADHYPRYIVRAVNQKRARESTAALNRTIRSIMSTPELWWKEKVGRVCYNLLVSPYAPDMHTYNTLMVAFDKAKNDRGYPLTESVVSSFFFGRLLKPTPVTWELILSHYKNTRNHGRFLRTVSCIIGRDDRTGAKISRRHILDAYENASVTKWAKDPTRTSLSGQFVNENVPLTTSLLETIISGFLQFKLFEQAGILFCHCAREGIALSAQLLRDLVDGCISHLDWKGAIRVLQTFTNYTPLSTLQGGDENDMLYLGRRITVLIDMCGLMYWKGKKLQPKEKFDNPEGLNHLRRLRVSWEGLGRLLETLERIEDTSKEADRDNDVRPGLGGAESRLLQIESVWKEYVRVRKTTRSIESKLLGRGIPHELRVSLVDHIVRDASRQSSVLSAEFRWLSQSMAAPRSDTKQLADDCLAFEDSMKQVWSRVDERLGEAAQEASALVVQETPELEAQATPPLETQETRASVAQDGHQFLSERGPAGVAMYEKEKKREPRLLEERPIMRSSRWTVHHEAEHVRHGLAMGANGWA